MESRNSGEIAALVILLIGLLVSGSLLAYLILHSSYKQDVPSYDEEPEYIPVVKAVDPYAEENAYVAQYQAQVVNRRSRSHHTSPPQETGDITSNLLVYLPFSEGSTSTVFGDASGSGRNGFCNSSQCPVSGVAGKIGNGVSFVGENDSVIVDGVTNLPQLTVSAWFNSNEVFGATRRMEIVNIDEKFLIRNDERTEFGSTLACHWFSPGTALNWTTLNSLFVPQPNTWYLVTCTHDGSTAKLYVNGQLQTSMSNAPPVGWNVPYGVNGGGTSQVSIGGYKWNVGVNQTYINHFNGIIDEVRIYDRALGQDDVQRLYSLT